MLTLTNGATQASFLQFLTTFPQADLVAQAMMRGPLAPFGCRATSLWKHGDFEDLVRIGLHGGAEYDDDRYARISLAVKAPLTESFKRSAVVLVPLEEVTMQFPNLEMDQDFWSELTKRNGNGDVGHVPIIVHGAPIGVYVFLCDQVHDWTPMDLVILDSLAASLGLWMSHPESKAMDPRTSESFQGLSLSARQIAILNLVREGKSNTAISTRLGYSQSTIKQELRWIMRRLRVTSRADAVTRATDLNLLPLPSTSKQSDQPTKSSLLRQLSS